MTEVKHCGQSEQTKILCVGLICVDIVQLCEEYVSEDSKKRCIDLKYQRGGNACNNCTVLSQLGCPVEFLGILYNDELFNFIQQDMNKNNIEFSSCPIIEYGRLPISTVMLSEKTGSRTIVHYTASNKELSLNDFKKVNLNDYSWIHFEGRNISEVSSMMEYIKSYNDSLIRKQNETSNKLLSITTSVELEKPDDELLRLLKNADIAFISKDFARSRGLNSMTEAIANIKRYLKPGAILLSAWGDQGAMALTPDGSIVHSPIYPPNKIVDTLGAGDTFNAGVLHYLNREKSKCITNCTSEFACTSEIITTDILRKAIQFGCQIAGLKISFRGFEKLGELLKRYFIVSSLDDYMVSTIAYLAVAVSEPADRSVSSITVWQ
ncbi:ketohexokinase-like [Phymastichus coffea]|uniref:ketohexokinase-like n=1 Tax=Phymastichus coffea TaxID=108790 RepID=UPI00273A8A06|nr:ketohexokinase-like [Phymastichus coffea]